MKILVTGGLGFIGSHTAVELQNEGFEVIIIDSTEPKERFDSFDREIEARYPKLKVTHIIHSGRLFNRQFI